MATPLISIVLPTYNGSRYISKSIESCLEQTMPDFELIVVNDCSTDNTLSLIQGFAEKDSRVRIINNEFNKKLPLSLNMGFEQAKGKYFTWTSDDNFYAPDALKKMSHVLETNPDKDLVYTDYYIIDENDKVTGSRRFGDVNESFNRWLGAGACFLYKREVHKTNNGYNPAAFLIEDYDFFVRAFMNFNFYYLPVTDLYYYREHSASLTSTQNTAINDISKIFLERNLPGLEKKLTEKERALLYRKFAVYYAVTKNFIPRYQYYLSRLRSISISQAGMTVIYVLIKKFLQTLTVGFAGIAFFLKLLFRSKN